MRETIPTSGGYALPQEADSSRPACSRRLLPFGPRLFGARRRPPQEQPLRALEEFALSAYRIIDQTRVRVPGADARARFVRRGHRHPAATHTRALGASRNAARATRSRHCATASTAPTRCSCPNGKCWWTGRPLPTCPTSKAIRKSSASTSRISSLAFGAWLDAGKASEMDRAVEALARTR